MQKSIFIAATGQHQGKTTTSLGIFALLRNHFKKVGFMKPVGQELAMVHGKLVDKDVALFSELFDLKDDPELMSPVTVPSGFTKDYLDGKIDVKNLQTKIIDSYATLSNRYDCLVVEGTGHMGVGSIFGLNNAKVAHLLGLRVAVVTTGGLGSSFDQIALQRELCQNYGSQINGVFLNRVIPEKKEVISHYMQKALDLYGIPLLGSFSLDPLLSNPTMQDYATLFGVHFLAGGEFALKSFQKKRLVATSVETYLGLIAKNQLVITPATRSDIILATYRRHWEDPEGDFNAGFILTGSHPPDTKVISLLERAKIPTIYTPISTFAAMQKITSLTAKINGSDTVKVEEAIKMVLSGTQIEKLMNLIN